MIVSCECCHLLLVEAITLTPLELATPTRTTLPGVSHPLGKAPDCKVCGKGLCGPDRITGGRRTPKPGNQEQGTECLKPLHLDVSSPISDSPRYFTERLFLSRTRACCRWNDGIGTMSLTTPGATVPLARATKQREKFLGLNGPGAVKSPDWRLSSSTRKMSSPNNKPQ